MKIRDKLVASKQRMHRILMEKFNLKKLYEVESKAQYRAGVSNKFAALENLDDGVDVNSA
jgi:hypothetical protein